ncbi:redoxin domain-containing protein [Streptosporangium sp. NPDC023615]|uniref:TlpA family protein disulfide reductase n=1 Tax=Streptosporangium sp. NPDC023615 TaxID=3154794 RepID=UPI00343DEB1C
MSFLITAVVFVGSLGVLNLILMLGVIRRLREHTALLSARGDDPFFMAAGEEVGEFTASTTDGETLSRDLLKDETLVAFFSPDCLPCKEKLPKFVEFARAMAGGRDRVLAAVVGDEDEAAAFAAELSPVARVVIEKPGDALNAAFRIRAYPSVLTVAPDEGGRLLVRNGQVELDRPVAAI